MSLAILGSGCIVPKDVGQGTDDGEPTGDSGDSDDSAEGSTSEGPGGSGMTTGGPGTAGSGTTDDGPHMTSGSAGFCDEVPGFECDGPVACGDGNDCGDTFSPFDEQGCLRPLCGDTNDCGAGEVCFYPIDYGGCASGGIFCTDESGTCGCGGDADCGGSYCLPEAQVPTEACFGLDDQQSCLDADCNHFETVTEITETCDCVPGQPACLQFFGGIGGDDSPDYFWHEQTLTVALFGTSWAELPFGWRSCSEPGSPPACECYEPFMDPMCP